MVQWLLNLRWASGAYAETLAKVDFAVLALSAAVLVFTVALH